MTGWDGYFEEVIVEPFSTIPYKRQSRKERKKFNIKGSNGRAFLFVIYFINIFIIIISDTPLDNRMFVFKHIRYIYSNEQKTFVPLM